MSPNVPQCPVSDIAIPATATATATLTPVPAPDANPDADRDGDGECQTLTQKQNNALTFMITGARPDEIAAAMKIDRRTLYRWRQLPAFARELRARRAAVLDAANDHLRALLDRALALLEDQLA